MLRLTAPLLPSILLLAACGGDGGDPLDRSCKGKAVPNCRPYEYSVAQGASLEPDGVMVGDPDQDVDVRVELATCGDEAPEPHIVAISARAEVSSAFDAGARTMIYELVQLRDDGTTFGDDMARDGVVEVTIDNPFIGDDLDQLAGKDVILEFEPRTPPVCDDMGLCVSCRGEPHEIDYHVGPRFMP